VCVCAPSHFPFLAVTPFTVQRLFFDLCFAPLRCSSSLRVLVAFCCRTSPLRTPRRTPPPPAPPRSTSPSTTSRTFGPRLAHRRCNRFPAPQSSRLSASVSPSAAFRALGLRLPSAAPSRCRAQHRPPLPLCFRALTRPPLISAPPGSTLPCASPAHFPVAVASPFNNVPLRSSAPSRPPLRSDNAAFFQSPSLPPAPGFSVLWDLRAGPLCPLCPLWPV